MSTAGFRSGCSSKDFLTLFFLFFLNTVVLGAWYSGLPLVMDASVLVDDFALYKWSILKLPGFPEWKPGGSPDAIKLRRLPVNLITDGNKTCLKSLK